MLSRLSLFCPTNSVALLPWITSGAPTPLPTEHASCIVQAGIVDVHEERVRHLAILLQVDAARRGDAERELAADGQTSSGETEW